MELLKLPGLAVGAPPDIATMGIAQIDIRNLLEAACPIKAGGKLVWRALL
jgi:hypothetical protein